MIIGCARVPETSSLPEAPISIAVPPECTVPSRSVDGVIHEIDAQRSRIRISVFRDGRLSRLGHNHIVTSGDLHGYALEGGNSTNSMFALCIPVNELAVDDPTARVEAGPAFATSLDQSLIAATRTNMLSEVQL
ncbi:MAG: hypothetical protein GTO41_05315, partial [Burkholderiales bacterium]|nr:hypothetical protein [Burkholderiales bacterium]